MEQFNYSATNELYAFEKMHNYNKFIARLMVNAFRKAGFKNGIVLDFGAGIGTLSSVMREHEGITPLALEIDKTQADIVAERGFKAFTSLDQIEKIDACFSSNVLEHIEDDVAALRDIREKMNTDGSIALFVPAFQSLWTEMDDQVGHHRRYTTRSLSVTLGKAGYEVIDIHYCDSLGFFAVMLLKLLGSRRKAETGSFMSIYDRLILPLSLLIDKLGAKYFFGKNVFALAKRKN